MGGTIEAPKPEQIISDLRSENAALRRVIQDLLKVKRGTKAWHAAVKDLNEILNPRQRDVPGWDEMGTADIDWAILKKAFGKTQRSLPKQYGGDGLYYLMDGSKKVNQAEMNRDDAKARNFQRASHDIKPRWWWSGKK